MSTFTAYDPTQHNDQQITDAVITDGLTLSAPIQYRYGEVRHFLDFVQNEDGSFVFDDNGLPVMNESRSSSISFYDGSLSALNIGAGLLLSTGTATPAEENTSSSAGEPFDTTFGNEAPHEALQNALEKAFETRELTDTTSLTFTFNITDPSIKGIQFDAVFGSEEYPEFADSDYVDIGGIFVNGQNYGLFNGDPQQPLSILGDNIEAGNFIDNTEGVYPIEYDGFSPLLRITAPVQQGLNTIEIAIADTGDDIYDSALFFSNLHSTPYSGSGLATVIQPQPESTVIEDISGDQVFQLPEGYSGQLIFDPTKIGNDLIEAQSAFLQAILPIAAAELAQIDYDPQAQVLSLDTAFGTKTFEGLDQIKLSDVYAALDTQSGGKTYEAFSLLNAALGAAPDTDTLSLWVDKANNAANNTDLANQIIDYYTGEQGIETSALAGLLYQNLIHETAPAEATALLTSLVGEGNVFETQGDLLNFAATHEVNQQAVAATGIIGSIQLLNPDFFA